jgi:CopG family transcriptional regulator/antitoxin EndoAI
MLRALHPRLKLRQSQQEQVIGKHNSVLATAILPIVPQAIPLYSYNLALTYTNIYRFYVHIILHTNTGFIMDIDNVRVNVTLPKELIKIVDELSGPRKRSLFIAEAVRFKIAQEKKEQLERKLIEGYRNSRKESIELAAEFESSDLEGWDEGY